MEYTIESIYDAFDGKLIGSAFMQQQVCETLQWMPARIIRYVTANCWFVSSLDDAWAFTFTGNDLQNQHLIFLSDELLNQNDNQIRYSIAHEIGHVVLGHRNSIRIMQTDAEIAAQEKTADEFAQQYTAKRPAIHEQDRVSPQHANTL